MILLVIALSICVIVLIMVLKAKPNLFVFQLIENVFDDQEDHIAGH